MSQSINEDNRRKIRRHINQVKLERYGVICDNHVQKPNISAQFSLPTLITGKSSLSKASEIKVSPSLLYPYKTNESHESADQNLESNNKKVSVTHTKDAVPPNQALLSMKPTIYLASSTTIGLKKKANYKWKDASPTYSSPEDFKSCIEKDIVPQVLKKPLSISTYKEYFQALLYAEDFYIEKWDGFMMKNVTLKLQEAVIGMSKGKYVKKTFVEFELDKIPERRPFLLSRDFVTVRPLTQKNISFQGIIYRVVKGNFILVEFGRDFHYNHDPSDAYDVKFSFNRVCLKRAHQAISHASKNLLKNFLFPKYLRENKVHDSEPSHGGKDSYVLQQILSLQGSPPYLLAWPFNIPRENVLEIIIHKISHASSSNRILLCARTNKTCDDFMINLKEVIPESDMFRANAAFRKLNEVPKDVLPACLYKRKQQCFSCPPLEKLLKFKVILSTYMSSYRLHDKGIMAGHFSHIFLVDASSVSEPETLVPLVNFANERTTVVVISYQDICDSWIRSTIARENGLRISYFERINGSTVDKNHDS